MDPLPADLAVRFPNIEIVDLRGAGPFSYLNPARLGRLTAEKLKIVAPLLGVPAEDMPQLRQEEEKRQQLRLGSLTGAMLGILVAVSGLSIFALERRYEAVRSLEDSMFATGSMVLLATDLDDATADSTARTRRLLVNQGCDLIDNLSSSSGVDPAISELVTCKLERARDRESQGEQAEARKLFEDAIANAGARYARLPRSDAADRLIQARRAYAGYLARQKDSDAAEAQYDHLVKDAQTFSNSNQARSEYVWAHAQALASLGDLLVARRNRLKAGTSYDEAAGAVRRAITLDGDAPPVTSVEWLVQLYRLAGEQHRLSDDPEGAILRYGHALKALNLIAGDQITPSLELEAAATHVLTSAVEQSRGDTSASIKSRTAALASIAHILESSTASTDLKQRANGLKDWIQTQQGGG
jgi:tetratricopeptide (TPR) repeat protein